MSMYRSSGEQVFARVARIRAQAQHILNNNQSPPPGAPSDEAEREAMAVAARVELRLPALAATFSLDALAVDAITCLLATEFDPVMRLLLRSQQRELGRPWIELGTIADLLELPPSRVPELSALFAPRGALRRFSLAVCDETDVPVVATRVKIAARVAKYLVGDDTPPDGMKLIQSPVQGTGQASEQLDESLVPAELSAAMVTRLERALSTGEALAIEIAGATGTGKKFFAEGLAARLGLPLLVVDLAEVDRDRDRGDKGLALAERLAEARREARLSGALLCLSHIDAHSPSSGGQADDGTGGPPPNAQPRRLSPPLARFLEQLDGPVLLTDEEREPLLERHAASVAYVGVPFPTPSQRGVLLEKALSRAGARATDDVDLSALARRYALDPARIEVAARAALELARERADAANGAGPIWNGGRLVSRNDLNDACRRQLRHDLKSLAVRVTASHKWEDLVIPVDVYEGLREMIAYTRHAGKVYEEWGFGARHSLAMGVSALFAGPPGTGKTMCASVMALELDMELFRVDLSRVVSKWIGETEKNLGKVFDEAQRSNAIILFDEADSLFAKRTDVKSSVDRYANLEVNFLLQRMEAFTGVTILTSNFEDTIDTAFKRRLTFRLRFEKPDAEARAALWRKVFPSGSPVGKDVDFDRLGALYEMSGGNIRNAAVRAAFLAANAETMKPIDMRTCMLAAERESREMGLLTKTQTATQAVREPEPQPLPPPAAGNDPSAPRLRPIGRPRRE